MNKLTSIDQLIELVSVYNICIKNTAQYSDAALLNWIGIDNFQKLDVKFPIENLEKDELLLLDNNGWTIIMDNCYYNLWHYHYQNDVWKKELGEKQDLLVYMFGDATEDFELTYYTKGSLRRQYLYEALNLVDHVESVNYGKPLPNELITSCPNTHEETIYNLKEQLGMGDKIDPSTIRLFRYQTMKKHDDQISYDW